MIEDQNVHKNVLLKPSNAGSSNSVSEISKILAKVQKKKIDLQKLEHQGAKISKSQLNKISEMWHQQMNISPQYWKTWDQMSQVERIDSLFADETPEEKEIAKK